MFILSTRIEWNKKTNDLYMFLICKTKTADSKRNRTHVQLNVKDT